MAFVLSAEPISVGPLREACQETTAGAFVTFEGWVRRRNEGREVIALDYEAYGPLAQTEADAILDEARARYPVVSIQCVHRVGRLALGDLAVWVGVTAEHRGAAFEACRYVIDALKARVPVWKKEFYVDGESAWINVATGLGQSQPGQKTD